MVVRRALALGIAVLISSLGLATSGDAQSGPTESIVETQTTVQAVDCDAQQITLAGAGVSSVAQSTLGTVIRVNGDVTPLCALSSYVGAPATAWVMARGGQVVLVRLDVTSTTVPTYPTSPAPLAPAQAPADPTTTTPYPAAPPPYTPVPAAEYPYSPAPPAYTPVPSAAAVVLGTVLVGGLVYLLVRSATGGLYRYPYYGPYVRPYTGYQQPAYRPYVGPYAKAPAYNYGPYRRCPDRSWGQWCR